MPVVYACIAPHPPVMVPAIGRGREQEMPRILEAMAVACDGLKRAGPATVVVISSHGPARSDVLGVLLAPDAAGSFAEFGAHHPVYHFENDVELAERLQAEARAEGGIIAGLNQWGHGLDWGCLVPLHYLAGGLEGTKVMPLVISGAPPERHFQAGHALARAVEAIGRRVAIVCSADLSHALSPTAPARYDPAGLLFDERYREAVARWDVHWMLHTEETFRRHAAEDAVRQTAVLMGCLSDYRIQPRVLAYDAPFGVGYLVATIEVPGVRPGREPAVQS